MIVKIKSKKEIEGFKIAGKEAARILDKLLSHIQVGCTPKDIDNIAIEECNKIYANPVFLRHEGFPAAICFSKNNVLVHGIPDDTPLKKGDVVSIDFGIEIDGFIGDTAETVVVGEDQSKLISKCRSALLKAIQVAVPGNRLSDIGSVIEKIANKNKYQIPKNYGGHGIDCGKLHAPPYVSNFKDYYNDFTLRPGVVLAIEPMFIDSESDNTTVSDSWSVCAEGLTAHCEHTILIDDSGPIILTRRKINE